MSAAAPGGETFHFTRDGRETAATYTIRPLTDEILQAFWKRFAAIPDDDLLNARAGLPVRSRSERDYSRLKELVIKHGLVALSDESGHATPLDHLGTLEPGFEGQVVAKIITTNVERATSAGLLRVQRRSKGGK